MAMNYFTSVKQEIGQLCSTSYLYIIFWTFQDCGLRPLFHKLSTSFNATDWAIFDITWSIQDSNICRETVQINFGTCPWQRSEGTFEQIIIAPLRLLRWSEMLNFTWTFAYFFMNFVWLDKGRSIFRIDDRSLLTRARDKIGWFRALILIHKCLVYYKKTLGEQPSNKVFHATCIDIDNYYVECECDRVRE